MREASEQLAGMNKSLQTYADQLIQSEHYAGPGIDQKKMDVLERWAKLQEALIKKRAHLGAPQTLLHFSRNADEEAGDLHIFLRDLDHFQAWLSKTESDIANEDSPSNLAEVEKLLSTHQQIGEEIDSYVKDYSSMMDYGEKVTADPSTFDDPQYMFLREFFLSLSIYKCSKETLNRQRFSVHHTNICLARMKTQPILNKQIC